MSNTSEVWSAARVRQLRILAAVSALANENAGGGTVTSETLARRMEGEVNLGTVPISEHLKALQDEGLVALDLRLGGVVAGARVLPGAHTLVEDFAQTRDSVPARRRQLRDDYLGWLYEQIEVHDASPTPDDYLKTGPSYMGVLYSNKDLEKSGEWLATNGFIQGQAAWQYAAPLRPSLTAKGAYTVEHGRSTNDPAPTAGDTFHTTVHGPANVAQGSSNFQQNLSVDWKSDGLRLVDTIEQAIPALSDELSTAIAEQVQVARDELAGAADISRLRAVFGALSGFLGQTGAGALGGLLTLQIAQFLGSLP